MMGAKGIGLCAVLIVHFLGASHISFAEQPPPFILEGDQYFNQGHYSRAREHYSLGWEDAKREGDLSLLSLISNNIAATYMATGDAQSFSKYFLFSKNLKSRLAERAKARPREKEGNLLVNGGFEQGLSHPWGTGHYERRDGKFRFGTWWNSMNAKAFMKIDTAVKHSGEKSLRITNFSSQAPHVFTTISQRVPGLEPNTVYRISFFAKAQNLSSGLFFTIDAAWVKRFLRLKAGTYDWKFYTGEINIGHNDYIDFRIIHENVGTVWLDDIVIQRVSVGEEKDLLQKAESLFDLAQYEEALELYDEIKEAYPSSMGVLRAIMLQTGKIHLILGNYNVAIERFHWLIDHGYRRGSINLGDLYYTLGAYEKAALFYKKGLDAVRGDQGTYSLVLNKLGATYLAQGSLKKALATQKQSLRILRHIEDRHGQARALKTLGMIYSHQEDYASASRQFASALALSKQTNDQKLLSENYYHLGVTAYLSGHILKARGLASKALSIKTKIKDEKGRIHVLHLQGLLSFSEGKHVEALGHYRKAAGLLERLYAKAGETSPETKALFLEQFTEFYRDYVDLLLLLHKQRPKKGFDEEAFRASEQARSRIFIEMLTHSRAARAFIETSKEKAFTGLLKEERTTWLRIRALRRSLDRLSRQPGSKEIEKLEARLAAAQKQYLAVQARLDRDYPRYKALKRPKPLSITEIRRLLAKDEALLSYFVTKNRTGLWAISQGAYRAVTLSRGRFQVLEATQRMRNAFPGVIQALHKIGKDDSKKNLKKAFSLYDLGDAYYLYQELVAPVKDILKDKTLIYLAPDDVLYQLPFEALLTKPYNHAAAGSGLIGSELKTAPFWVMAQSLSYLPSVSVLRLLRSLGKPKTGFQKPLIAFADPDFDADEDPGESRGITRSALLAQLGRSGAISKPSLPRLPDTREEALFAARVLGASQKEDVYLGRAASEHNVKRLPLKDYRYLLFATHGLIAGEFRPGIQPSLAMSFVGDPENDGILEMGEILGLDLNSEMAVLSACNTARGRKSGDRGEGFAGLTLSFMFAGAESLLVTLWSVESSTAKMLMQSAFQRILAQNRAGALAQAKRKMITSPGNLRLGSQLSVSTAHPFFWAPYILVGEGK